MAQHSTHETADRHRDERPATDKIGGLAHSLIKIVFGGLGSRTFVTTANPFPVTVASGGTSITPKFARIDQTTTTSTEIVAAVSDKKIRVVALLLSTTSSGNLGCVFLSATTEIAGPYFIRQGAFTAPIVLVPDVNGYFETASNEALNLKTDQTLLLGGSLVYIEV